MNRPLRYSQFALLSLLLLCLSLTAGAQTKPFLHQLFTSNMVLQRDASDPVWGWTTPGTGVTVVVKDQNGAALQTKTATSGSDGRWQVTVGPFGLVPGNAAYSMVVTGTSTSTLTNILIGDVWLCGGQSNMEFNLKGTYETNPNPYLQHSDGEIADAAANYPNIRQFKAAHASAPVPQETLATGIDYTGGAVNGSWGTTSSTAGTFCAVGYFMAREIYNSQHVPIGLLALNWGGTDMVTWIPGDYLRTISDFTPTVDALTVSSTTGKSTATALYNAITAPATNFKIKGAIWYQGENEAISSTGGPKYAAMLGKYMAGIRSKFGQPNLPFILVQLCTWNALNGSVDTAAQAPLIREAEINTALSDANSRAVVTIDCGYGTNIHPIDKQTPGKRMGQAALELVYGQTNEYRSPTFNHATVEGGALRCYFDNVGSGLMVGLKTPDTSGSAPRYMNAPLPITPLVSGTLTGFGVAGANQTWYNATATIDAASNTVVVSSPSVPNPLYVRYGWNDNPWNSVSGTPLCNLYRQVLVSGTVADGVPVSPFRNDPTYQLSVNDGSGGGVSYQPGQIVSISANAAPSGQAFAYWAGDSACLASATTSTTTVTLSQPFVSVRAMYRFTSAPSGLAATPGPGQVALSWTALPNAVSYDVYRSASAGGSSTLLATGITSTTYADTSAAIGTTWYYSVCAVNSAGEGPLSGKVAAASLDPNAPTGLTAVAGNAQVVVNWSSNGAASYNVKRSVTSGTGYVTLINTSGTSYTDSTAINGTTYYYVVTANTPGESGNSAEVSATPPGSVTWTGASSGNWSVAANWNGVTPLNYARLTFGTAATTALNNDLSNFIIGGLVFNSGASAFSLSGSSASLAGDIVNNATNGQSVSLPLVLMKNITVTTEPGAVTLGGVISESGGSYGITKQGSGLLTLNGANTFSGGLTLSNGKVTLGASSTGSSGNVTSGPVGTGTLTLDGGTLQMNSKTLHNAINVTGAPVIDETVNNGVLEGVVSGHGGLTLNNTSGNSLSLLIHNGAWSGFDGSITYNGGATSIHNLLFGVTTTGTWDLSHATFIAANSVRGSLSGGVASADLTVKLGTLSGNGVIDSAFTNSTTRYEIGGRGEDCVFSGTFKNTGSSATTTLTKVGAGTFTLSGGNSYKGTTTINGGKLNVIGTMSGTGALTVNNTGALSGTSTLPMAVTVNSGGTIAPGNSGPGMSGPGTLSLTGPLVLTNGSILEFELGAIATSDKLALSGGYTFASGTATVNVSTVSGFAGAGTYTLITGATGISADKFKLGATLASYTCSLQAASGTLSLVVTMFDAPTGLVATGSNACVALSWNPVSGATSYAVKRTTTSGSNYTTVGSTSSTSYVDTGRAAGSTYYYVVTASNDGGTTGNSAESGATTYTAAEVWRLQNFGTIDNTGNAAETADPDGDGLSNAQEFLCGTDPNDRASRLEVSDMQVGGNDVLISFGTVGGKTYRVEYSDALGGTWMVLQSNIPGTGGVVQVSDVGGAARPKRFYRIVVQ